MAGTITAQTIIDLAETDYQDEGNSQISAVEWLTFLNDGARAIVFFKPDAGAVNASFQLVEGVKQSLPSGGFGLDRVVRNTGSDGATPGAAIAEGDMEVQDRFDPDWHTATASASVRNFFYNPANPETFYVIPPQPSSSMGYVEAIYYKSPADIAAGIVIPIADNYANALRNYMLFRAHSMETESAEGSKAAGYLSIFNTALGIKTTTDQLLNAGQPGR